jgi:hypothetical protein
MASPNTAREMSPSKKKVMKRHKKVPNKAVNQE